MGPQRNGLGNLAAMVLCAGKGTRMKSERAKVLHALLGRPLCHYPISRALELDADPVVVVVGHQAEVVKGAIEGAFPHAPISFVLQAEQRGTAHAVQCALEALKGHEGPVLILYGDVPLLRGETLAELIDAFGATKGPLAMVTALPPEPKGYGRIIREGGRVSRVVEEKDATAAERAIGETNAGIYLVEAKFLHSALSRVGTSNAQRELYLTDIVELAAKAGEVAVVKAGWEETAGVNELSELAQRAAVLQRRINSEHMRRGVTIEHPETTFIEDGVEIGPDTVIGPMVTIRQGCEIGAGARLGQGSVLTKSTIADGVEIKPYSVLEEAIIGPRCVIGPFARLRPGTVLGERVHIGNFVETKKARIGEGSKANHLSYLGDAKLGSGVNVGAGTITCNYDGEQKHTTVLGDGVFIGSDTQLVAPVTVGAGAYVGAGSTITEDVPPMGLALSRAPQVVKQGWAAKRKGLKSKGRG
jgi:bifunctional UDP-N-acetylglucosamine pyrophosphorylase / glucosamine-1-phosphate N-acetyltransferase